MALTMALTMSKAWLLSTALAEILIMALSNPLAMLHDRLLSKPLAENLTTSQDGLQSSNTLVDLLTTSLITSLTTPQSSLLTILPSAQISEFPSKALSVRVILAGDKPCPLNNILRNHISTWNWVLPMWLDYDVIVMFA